MKYIILSTFLCVINFATFSQTKKTITIKRDQINVGRDVIINNTIHKTTIKNTAPSKRHLSKSDTDRLIKEIPSKTIPLVITIFNNDMESKQYADEIDNYLTKAGYNVELRGNIQDTYEYLKDKRFTIAPFYSDHSKHEILIIPIH